MLLAERVALIEAKAERDEAMLLILAQVLVSIRPEAENAIPKALMSAASSLRNANTGEETVEEVVARLDAARTIDEFADLLVRSLRASSPK